MNIYKLAFKDLYPLYQAKVEKKGRSLEELNQVIYWMTGHDENTLKEVLNSDMDLENFFKEAPKINDKVQLIKGVICGYRVEEIEDQLMKSIRQLDKLVDELAKGKKMEKILRE